MLIHALILRRASENESVNKGETGEVPCSQTGLLVIMALCVVVFFISLFAELIANDKPLLIRFDGNWYFPIVEQYTETQFGGEFESEADYTDPYVADLIEAKGFTLWPIIRFSYDTINYDLTGPAPSPPDRVNWLGTDDKGRDVMARIIYGFRVSVLFGFALTVISTIIGVIVGACQGYYGAGRFVRTALHRSVVGDANAVFTDYFIQLCRA